MKQTVEFEFTCGDYVETDLNDLGVVVGCSDEYGTHSYCVHGENTGRWYHPERLTLTDRRPGKPESDRIPIVSHA